MSTQIVVAGAVITDTEAGPALLIAQRRRPPELAGLWELPGGKVQPGESEPAALARELAEELGLDADAIRVGRRIGADVELPGLILRAYRVDLARGEPRADDHLALRWVTTVELPNIAWVPADRAWLADLARAL
ncbi:NUDIX domain-containing protein [Mycolicibacter sp. MYC123]|uniref:8-oxo-dGTP diphosphatase n=1 Tax=[Mycobacterium] zoologicum TaxID=2872311 RepID=A0ABU5YLC4_9MYCO|nr:MULTISPECIES: NUDIX domain-containing protein [unclassified Mycolicibacter]MEB3050868.1 NUDIX domain-containing protein [Mycolicibacter sp. MYC123]MEB3061283.1 NUDIX domain-containing protein [Mycolicibacter sp. MYC101]